MPVSRPRSVITIGKMKGVMVSRMAMIESIAIYCFVVSMILIFANPFWNHVIAHTAGK